MAIDRHADLYLAKRRSGKTHREIAREAGISEVYCTMILNGKYEPPATTLDRLRRVLAPYMAHEEAAS